MEAKRSPIAIDIRSVEFNTNYNKYDHLSQYPLLNKIKEDAHAIPARDAPALDVPALDAPALDATELDSIPLLVEHMPKKMPALVSSIVPIKHSLKKSRQLKNLELKKTPDIGNVTFYYENPYGFTYLNDRRYVTKMDFSDVELTKDEKKQKESTKYIICDKKSKNAGIILDSNTDKCLSVPPAPLLRNLNKFAINKINQFLEKKLYDIIKIEDGTIITLYSWLHPQNGLMWSMASNNGYDVSSYKWMGKLSYAEIVYDLATRLYPEFKEITGMNIEYIPHKNTIKTILTFENLDPKYCYSIGFRHHNFHPMKIDSERMWQVQYTDLSETLPKVYYGGIFPESILPVQTVYSYSYFSKDENVTYSKVRLKGESSLINTCIAIEKQQIEKSEHFDTDEGKYGEDENKFIAQNGFIFRSNDLEQTGNLSNFIIEYKLFEANKKLIYMQYKDKNVNEVNRMIYNAMRAFLNDERYDIEISIKNQFKLLYPEWNNMFIDFDEFINGLSTITMHSIIATESTTALPIVERLKFGKLVVDGEQFNNISKEFAKMIKRKFYQKKQINIHNLEKIVNNYIKNPIYASVYIHMFK